MYNNNKSKYRNSKRKKHIRKYRHNHRSKYKNSKRKKKNNLLEDIWKLILRLYNIKKLIEFFIFINRVLKYVI